MVYNDVVLSNYAVFLLNEIIIYNKYKNIDSDMVCAECVLQSLIEGKHRTYCNKNKYEQDSCRYYKDSVKSCGSRDVFKCLL